MNSAAPPCIVDVSREPSSVCVRLSGDANMNAVKVLGETLADVHARALVDRCPEVVVDVSRLEFINSTCFKEFLRWIAKVEIVDPSSRYRIRFRYDHRVAWQKRSLRALEHFAVGLVTVEGE